MERGWGVIMRSNVEAGSGPGIDVEPGNRARRGNIDPTGLIALAERDHKSA
jgi:hypothetical protein